MDPLDSTWFEVRELGSTAKTERGRPSLVIPGHIDQDRGNFLKGNTTYRVSATAFRAGGQRAKDEFSFRTNAEPYGGSCTVSPRNGTAIHTEFQIKCSGWKDEQMPLTYEFRYRSRTGMVVIEKGPKSGVNTTLPVGEPAEDYIIKIEIQIIDNQGASRMALAKVHVKPVEYKNVTEILRQLTTGKESTIGGLIRVGDIDKAARMAYSILSMVETEDELSREYKKLVKDSIIDQIVAANLSSLEQVTRLAVVVTIAMDDRDEISQDSQEKAADLLERMIDFIRSHVSNGSNLELVEEVGSSLLHGAANLMRLSSFEARVVDTKDGISAPKDENKRKRAKALAKRTLEMLDRIGSTLLTLKTIGEKPSVFETKPLTLVLLRDTPEALEDGRTLRGGDGEVRLPSAQDLLGRDASDMKAVDFQKVEFRHNPFTWDMSSANITSGVLDFSVKTNKGVKVNISGLQNPVELYIPRLSDANNSSVSVEKQYFLKPGHIQRHRIWFSEGEVAYVKIKPQHGTFLEVYVSHEVKPTRESHDYYAKVPNYSSCRNSSSDEGYFDCASDPYTISLSILVTGHSGDHFLGVSYESSGNEETKGPLHDVGVRRKRDCGNHGGRQKRSCIGVKDPPTTPPPTPRIVVPQYNSSTDVNYTMSVRLSSCMYWSETEDKWTHEGCQAGPNSGPIQLHCLCNHLSAFGGDFLVAPNPIDFTKVWAEFGRLGETGNFVVLATVCSIFGLYFVALVFARRADKRDEAKVVANVFLSEPKDDGYVYEIAVVTGMWRGYGTTANVVLSIYGENGALEDIRLTDPDLHKRFFSRGSVNNFTLTLPDPLGPLSRIKIWHDNSGASPAWFLHQVVIRDVQDNHKYHFLGNRWLALERGTGQLEANIPVADRRELVGFKNLFYSRTAKNLGDGHLWLSLLTRPPHVTFTRCQRLSCCLSILLAVMVTNAMFYQFNKTPSDTFELGPLKLSWTQIKIGLQSSIVAIPVNALVVAIFRNIKPKLHHGENQESSEKTAGCLPHFFLFIGWALCLLTALIAAAFIVFYSLMWGKETSIQWLISITVSFFQDVVITQPVKVVLLASFLSLIFRKPVEQDRVFGSSTSMSTKAGYASVKRLRGKELRKAREFRKKRLEMFQTIIEIALFLFFVILLMIFCYGNRTSSRFALTKTLRDTFSKFHQVKSVETFWIWTRIKLAPGLFDSRWYNDRPFEYKEGFISSRETFLVGMPRLRQIRIKPESVCKPSKAEPLLVSAFSKCLPVYSDENEDKTPYNQPGWIPVINASHFSSPRELKDLCPKPWRYAEAKSLNTRPVAGLKEVYGGGGFVADLGYNSRSALKVLADLQAHEWIDGNTVAVFIEFTVFEPASALFSAVKYLYERHPTGGINTVTTIRTLTLYSPPDPSFRSLYQVCQLLLIAVVFLFFLAEIGRLYRQKWSYFKQFWNWIALLQIFLSVAMVVMFFLKEKFTSEFVKRVQKNPFETSSTDYIIFWSDMEVYLLSLVIFLVTLNFLRLIRFNRHVCQMTGTIKGSMIHMSSFLVIFMSVILAYTQLACLVFGPSVAPYSSVYKALSSLLQMILGGNMYFYELSSASAIIGPLFVFAYTMSMAMVLLNMFLAILNESYQEVQETYAGKFSNAELGEFMSNYFQVSLLQYGHNASSYCRKLWGIIQKRLRLKRSVRKSYLRVPLEESNVQETQLNYVDEMSNNAKIASFESLTDIFFDPEGEEMEDVKSILSEIEEDARGSFAAVSAKEECDEKECCFEKQYHGYCTCMLRVNLWGRESMKFFAGEMYKDQREFQANNRENDLTKPVAPDETRETTL